MDFFSWYFQQGEQKIEGRILPGGQGGELDLTILIKSVAKKLIFRVIETINRQKTK